MIALCSLFVNQFFITYKIDKIDKIDKMDKIDKNCLFIFIYRHVLSNKLKLYIIKHIRKV